MIIIIITGGDSSDCRLLLFLFSQEVRGSNLTTGFLCGRILYVRFAKTQARLYWVFLSLPDRCVCDVCALSYCRGAGHGSRHRALCANLSDLSDMAYVLNVC